MWNLSHGEMHLCVQNKSLGVSGLGVSGENGLESAERTATAVHHCRRPSPSASTEGSAASALLHVCMTLLIHQQFPMAPH